MTRHCSDCDAPRSAPCADPGCPLRIHAALAHCPECNLWLQPDENCLHIQSTPSRLMGDVGSRRGAPFLSRHSAPAAPMPTHSHATLNSAEAQRDHGCQ